MNAPERTARTLATVKVKADITVPAGLRAFRFPTLAVKQPVTQKQGDIGAAIAAYDRATERDPSLTEAWFRAGALVYTLGHRDEAIGCFRRAAATGANTSFGRLGKARALLIENRNQEAEKVLRHTLALDPRNAMAHDLLGNLLSEFGRFEEARECFQRAIEIAPLLAGSYYDLVRCRPITRGDDGLLQRMEAALATTGRSRSPTMMDREPVSGTAAVRSSTSPVPV